jgi:excisionase family DNA binding protein
MIDLLEEQYLTSQEVCKLLDISRRTLDSWNHEGTGPESVKPAGRRLYKRSAVVAWLEGQ